MALKYRHAERLRNSGSEMVFGRTNAGISEKYAFLPML
jgi:hypothetical protein